MPEIHKVEAYSFASRFLVREVAAWLALEIPQRLTKTQLVLEWRPDSIGFAYDFGALVLVNVPEAMRDDILRTLMARLPREPHPPLREDFLIEVRPGAAIEATFDRIVVPALSPTFAEVIATVLAQSVSLDYYDEDVEAILRRVGAIASDVARDGRPRGQSRDLVRFVGQAIVSQVEIISAISLLDKPDLTWEDEAADRLHDKLRYSLEIPERYKALEAKIVTIREAIDAFLELTSTRRMMMLEIAVVVLIAAEILIGFLKLH